MQNYQVIASSVKPILASTALPKASKNVLQRVKILV
jgi:hypothetical protein